MKTKDGCIFKFIHIKLSWATDQPNRKNNANFQTSNQILLILHDLLLISETAHS